MSRMAPAAKDTAEPAEPASISGTAPANRVADIPNTSRLNPTILKFLLLFDVVDNYRRMTYGVIGRMHSGCHLSGES